MDEIGYFSLQPYPVVNPEYRLAISVYFYRINRFGKIRPEAF